MDDSCLSSDILNIIFKMFPQLKSFDISDEDMEAYKEEMYDAADMYGLSAYKHMKKHNLQDIYLNFMEFFNHHFFNNFNDYASLIALAKETNEAVKMVESTRSDYIRLYFKSNKSNKIYNAEIHHHCLILEYGKPNKTTVIEKDFDTYDEVRKEFIKKVISKVKSGYKLEKQNGI